MRQVAIVTVKLAIDLLDFPEEREGIISDTLTGVLTENMQMFNENRGNLVDWELAPYPLESNLEIIQVPDAAVYEEGDVFIEQEMNHADH